MLLRYLRNTQVALTAHAQDLMYKVRGESNKNAWHTQNCFAYNSASKYRSEAILYSKWTAGCPQSPHIKTIAIAFLRAETEEEKIYLILTSKLYKIKTKAQYLLNESRIFMKFET